jgi:hypothetical protein
MKIESRSNATFFWRKNIFLSKKSRVRMSARMKKNIAFALFKNNTVKE